MHGDPRLSVGGRDRECHGGRRSAGTTASARWRAHVHRRSVRPGRPERDHEVFVGVAVPDSRQRLGPGAAGTRSSRRRPRPAVLPEPGRVCVRHDVRRHGALHAGRNVRVPELPGGRPIVVRFVVVRRTCLVLCAVLATVAQLVVSSPSASATTPVTVTLSASSTSPTVGDVVQFSGSVSPFVAGTAVHPQWLVSGVWHTAAATQTVSASGAFGFSLKPLAGTTRYRAVVDATGGLASGTSPTVSLATGPANGWSAAQLPDGLDLVRDPVNPVACQAIHCVVIAGETVGSVRGLSAIVIGSDGSRQVYPLLAPGATFEYSN